MMVEFKTMDKLVIDKMRDYIIVEKYDNNKILRGSKLFCGCCGNILGVTKKELKFPFSVSKFDKSVYKKEKKFSISIIGLYHKTCGHSMFCFSKGYNFMGLDKYIENTKKSNKNNDNKS